MTGKDLIIYILENNLENEPIFKNGKLVGFLTAVEAAEKLDVGIATIYALVDLRLLNGIFIGDAVYIPVSEIKESRY